MFRTADTFSDDVIDRVCEKLSYCANLEEEPREMVELCVEPEIIDNAIGIRLSAGVLSVTIYCPPSHLLKQTSLVVEDTNAPESRGVLSGSNPYTYDVPELTQLNNQFQDAFERVFTAPNYTEGHDTFCATLYLRDRDGGEGFYELVMSVFVPE